MFYCWLINNFEEFLFKSLNQSYLDVVNIYTDHNSALRRSPSLIVTLNSENKNVQQSKTIKNNQKTITPCKLFIEMIKLTIVNALNQYGTMAPYNKNANTIGSNKLTCSPST